MRVTDALHLVSALARRVWRPETGEALLVRMCRAVVDLLGADGGALTCAPTEACRFTACATDEVALRLGDLEEAAGDGPGLRAYREQRSVGTRVGRQDDPHAFPLFSSVAAELAGPLLVRSWPVRRGGVPVAVLTLYAREPGPEAAPGAVEDGQVLADALGSALVPAPFSGSAPACRAPVHRAVGMVVAQTGLPPQDALALLRARAFTDATTVAEVADDVLARRLTFAEDAPTGR